VEQAAGLLRNPSKPAVCSTAESITLILINLADLEALDGTLPSWNNVKPANQSASRAFATSGGNHVP
jgi:hypothetical protein